MPDPQVVRFGEFELDLRSGELARNGSRVLMPDQPLRLLALLIRERGSLVTRDELRRQLWRDDTFVDFEPSLNAAVKRLRETLGDSAVAPRFIETLPRRGYRFIAPVMDGGSPPPAGHIALQAAPAGLELRHPSARSRVILFLLAALLVGAAAWCDRPSPAPRVAPDGQAPTSSG